MTREQWKAHAQSLIDRASGELAAGAISEAQWSQRVSDALAEAYLREDDLRWQSGFDGDAALWREARELVLDPVSRHGSYLDVGCATGHLMDCLAEWSAQRGIALEVFGLELSPRLADAARRRLPSLAPNVFEGDVAQWIPPRRFTYVRTGLEYVPSERRPFLITRLLHSVIEPGGRLIAGPVAVAELDAHVASFRAAGITAPGVCARSDRNGKTRAVVWCTAP